MYFLCMFTHICIFIRIHICIHIRTVYIHIYTVCVYTYTFNSNSHPPNQRCRGPRACLHHARRLHKAARIPLSPAGPRRPGTPHTPIPDHKLHRRNENTQTIRIHTSSLEESVGGLAGFIYFSVSRKKSKSDSGMKPRHGGLPQPPARRCGSPGRDALRARLPPTLVAHRYVFGL